MDQHTVGICLVTTIALIFIIGVTCILIDIIRPTKPKEKIVYKKPSYNKYEEYEISSDLID